MRMRIQAGVCYKGKIYFSDWRGFGLFSFDLVTKEVHFCRMFEEVECVWSHRAAFLYHNEAWFLPQNGTRITCVNLDTYEIMRFEIPYVQKIEDEVLLLAGGLVMDDMLFCVPWGIDTLTIINMRTHQLHFYTEFIDPEKENIFSFGEKDRKAIFYPYMGEYIRILDPLNGRWEMIKREDHQYEYGEVAITAKGYLYAPGKKGELMFGSGATYAIPCARKWNEYYGHYQKGNEILFFPFDGSDFLKVNIDTMEWKKLHVCNDEITGVYDIMMRIDSDSGLYLASGESGYVIEIRDDDSMIYYPIEVKEKELQKEIAQKTSDSEKKKIFEFNKREIINEDWKYSLEGFLKFIM